MESEPFQFAGFTWPRRIPRLVRRHNTAAPGMLAIAHDRPKWRVDTAYSSAPKPNDRGGSFFYLDSDFMPGLRWKWCDDICRSIRHTGWYTDEYGDGEKIRGIVFTLPSGRGFLAGWSMGEGMASVIMPEVYECEIAAAHSADSIAESQADKERDYQAAQAAEEDGADSEEEES